jgi:hypothetical protein
VNNGSEVLMKNINKKYNETKNRIEFLNKRIRAHSILLDEYKSIHSQEYDTISLQNIENKIILNYKKELDELKPIFNELDEIVNRIVFIPKPFHDD